MNDTSFFHFRPHISFQHLIAHTPVPEERHFFSQPVAMPSSSSDLLCYFKVALDDYPPVFYLAFVTIDSVARPHLPEDSWISHSVLCWLQEVEEYEMGQQVERRWGGWGTPSWKPIVHSEELQIHPVPADLPHFLTFSSSLWLFVLTTHLAFSPHQPG